MQSSRSRYLGFIFYLRNTCRHHWKISKITH